MTNEEFKAWFDGFSENIEDVPNEKQWKKIKQRVKEIDNTPVTREVFIDRYYPIYKQYWNSPFLSYTGDSGLVSGKMNSAVMKDVGKAEYMADLDK